VDDVSVLLEYDAASLGNWFPAFEDNAMVSEVWEPFTQWPGVISQKLELPHYSNFLL